jgi:uncharacterized protein
VDVTRFDVDDAGNAVLDARWWVYGRNGEKLLRSGRSTISEPAAAGDYTSTAAALSRALGAMSEEIAQTTATALAHRPSEASVRRKHSLYGTLALTP